MLSGGEITVRGGGEQRGYRQDWQHVKKNSIKTLFKSNKKVSQFFRPVKGSIPLHSAGVYKLDCDCGIIYQTPRRKHIHKQLHSKSYQFPCRARCLTLNIKSP